MDWIFVAVLAWLIVCCLIMFVRLSRLSRLMRAMDIELDAAYDHIDDLRARISKLANNFRRLNSTVTELGARTQPQLLVRPPVPSPREPGSYGRHSLP